MNNKELYAKFKEAERAGFVEDFGNPSGCSSECEDCPAKSACIQMSNGSKDFALFKVNFSKMIKEVEDGTDK